MLRQPIKYNPAFLSDEELVQAFVVRHTECDMIMQVIRENDTEPNKHILIIGPRGSGKTMLVRRVAVEVKRDIELNEKWYPLIFAEESYLATTPGEFWLEALFHLGQQTGDQRWEKTHEELRKELDEDRLRERALAQLLDFADSIGKRILLIVENLNQLFGEQLKHEIDAWTLRNILQHEPRLMLLGTATTRFKEVENSDMAMFDLFVQHDLRPLHEADCLKVWCSVTGEESKDRRIRPIQILTGGSPRLLAIISAFAAELSFKELMTDLVRLVDDHTEYFKSHLDSLPAIERKVYLAMTDMWHPVSAKEIAVSARLNVNKISALMGRLIERGAVVPWKVDGKRKLYHVAERLYNIYYLMRRRGSPSSRVEAAVNFMLDMYEKKEYSSIMCRIAEEACDLDPELRMDHYIAFGQLLEHPTVKSESENIIQQIPQRFFEAEDAPEFIKKTGKTKIRNELRLKLGYLAEHWETIDDENDDLATYEEAHHKLIDLYPEESLSHALLGTFYHQKYKKYDEAEIEYRKAIEIDNESAETWAQLGLLLHEKLEKYDEAESVYRKAIEIKEEYAWAWAQLGNLFHEKLERYDEAEIAYRKAIEIDKENAWAWTNLGLLLETKLERYDEAEKAYRNSIRIKPDADYAWHNLGVLLERHFNDYEEAEKAYKMSVEINADDFRSWFHLAQLYCLNLKKYESAEKAIIKAIELNPNDPNLWLLKSTIRFIGFKDVNGAKVSLIKVINLKPLVTTAWINLINLYKMTDSTNEVFDLAEKNISKHSKNADLLNAISWAFYESKLYEYISEAESWIKEAVALSETDPQFNHTLASIYAVQGKGKQALDPASQYLKSNDLVEEDVEYAIDLFTTLAATGFAKEALDLIQDSPSEYLLEPLVVGLRLYLGDSEIDIRAPVEILEVGKDVKEKIEERKEELKQ
ncbi:tetratricopeptide repeat protein [bacterium]|nr:tetratricopeptide repeat protein [bacterium]